MRIPALSIALLCVGCGTFPLAGQIVPKQANTTMERLQLDSLICKDQAATQSQTAGDQARGFVLGMTLVGIPADFEIQKQDQRRIFKSCMEARGYEVMPAAD